MKHTRILYTKQLRNHLLTQVQQHAQQLTATKPPGLSVIQVGTNEASSMYVRKKKETAEKLGIQANIISLPENTSFEDLQQQIDALNHNDAVTAILLQLPLPPHLDKFSCLNLIRADKDVDGLTAINTGLMEMNQPQTLLPATPLGIMRLLEWAQVDPCGKNAVVVGRSHLVGRPVAHLLGQKEATVTTCHKQTRDMLPYLKQADIVICATGCPHLINGSMLKQDAVVVDVGTTPMSDEGKKKLVGDVDMESCSGIASIVTPVPGGVGPMTVASLMTNTIDATCLQLGQPKPDWNISAPLGESLQATG